MSHSSAPERATGAVTRILATGKCCVLATTRSTYCQPQPVDFRSLSAAGVLRMDVVQRCCAVNLPKVGFNFTTNGCFLLTALPSVSGALLRVPYSFMVPIFGGRRWTAFSTGILIIPCVWLGFAVQDTSTPYSVFIIILCCAALLARTSLPVWQTSASSSRNRSRVARWA